MAYLFSTLKDYLVLLPLFCIIEILFYLGYKKQGIHVGIGFIIGWQLLAGLLTAIYSVTGAGGINDIIRYGLSTLSPEEINLIPLKDWSSYNQFGMAMNILLFTPLGLLLPLLWQKGATFFKTVGTGLLLSLGIEISQLFNFRATDIDDLLMNTLGTALGFGIYYLLLKRITVFQVENNGMNLLTKNSPIACVFLLFTFLFCLGKPLLTCFWKFYYGD